MEANEDLVVEMDQPVDEMATSLAVVEAVEEKAVPPNVDSPMADRAMRWDGAGARSRVLAWAGGPDKENVDWEKYAKAFAWYDADNMDVLGSYKLPHHDIVDGELKVVYSGTVAAKAALAGARGGVDLPDDRAKAEAHIAYHMEQFGEEDGYGGDDEEKRVSVFDTEILSIEKMRGGVMPFYPDKPKKEMKPRTVYARISTTSIDRDGDVLLPSGLDLGAYRKNPIVLLNHKDGGLPIGKALSVKRDSGGVIAAVQFAERPAGLPDAVEWVPDTVFDLFQQGVLKGFSVGFIPKEMREPTEKDMRKFGDGVKNIISKWELLEFSVVNVPANEDALVVQVAKSHKWLADAWGIDCESCGQTGDLVEASGSTRRWKCDAGVPRLELK